MDNLSIPILMYHGLEPRQVPAAQRWHLPAKTFENQMFLLKKLGFETIGLTEVLDVLSGHRTDFSVQCPVLLTFDDALESQFSIAFPVLKKLGFQAVLFVPTFFIENQKASFDGLGNQKFMDWQQVLELKKAGWGIGSHGHQHLRLGKILVTEAFHDLSKSKEILEEKLESKVDSLAFPFGDYNFQILQLAQKLGFRAAFSVHDGLAKIGCELLRIPRVELNQSIELVGFQRILHKGFANAFAEAKGGLRDFVFQKPAVRDALRSRFLFHALSN